MSRLVVDSVNYFKHTGFKSNNEVLQQGDKMEVYHTSPEKIEKIEKYGMFNDCLFFAPEPYSMGVSVDECFVYELDLDETKVIHQSMLDNQEIVNHIKHVLDIDDGDAEDLLDGTNDGRMLDAEDGWFIQAMQGECATKMGYDACESIDEQGKVYIVPCLNKLQDMRIVQ